MTPHPSWTVPTLLALLVASVRRQQWAAVSYQATAGSSRCWWWRCGSLCGKLDGTAGSHPAAAVPSLLSRPVLGAAPHTDQPCEGKSTSGQMGECSMHGTQSVSLAAVSLFWTSTPSVSTPSCQPWGPVQIQCVLSLTCVHSAAAGDTATTGLLGPPALPVGEACRQVNPYHCIDRQLECAAASHSCPAARPGRGHCQHHQLAHAGTPAAGNRCGRSSSSSNSKLT